MAAADAEHRAALQALRDREAALAAERKALEARQGKSRERLEVRRDKAAADYAAAMERWRAG